MVDTVPDYTKGQSIREQELQTLAIDIATQTINQLGIDVEAQSIGDIDILFNDQNVAVEDAREFAASQGNVVQANLLETVSSGGNTSNEVYSNNTGSAAFLEFFAVAADNDNIDGCTGEVQVDDSTGFITASAKISAVAGPANFNPPIEIPDGGSVDIVLENFESSSIPIEGQILVREQ